MLTMEKIRDVRFRYFVKGETISKVATDLVLDWKTVQKYVDMSDFNESAVKPEKRFFPKLDRFKATIDKWLEEDKKAPRKQRHTARRVFNRLTAEFPEFNCSYRTVASYYVIRRKELFSGATTGFLPLEHHPGEAQVDFGAADYYENGTRISGRYLEVSFPYSNKGYLQLFPGENMECLLEGLDSIFRHIGAVPDELWFDNAKTIVTKIIRGGKRETTERFDRFREHYRFHAVFMNPGEGHEKGNVENKVGYHRRNLLVPVPRFESLVDFNRVLLAKCDSDAEREHYRHNETLAELFLQDLKHSHGLPEIPFDLGGRRDVTANNWGKFYLHRGMHEYSVSPKYVNMTVHLKMSSSLVIVMDESYREIVRHRRLYGDAKQQSMDWLPYLRQLSLRPRALKYSGVYEMMPSDLKQFLEDLSHTETGKVLRVLAELTDRTGFDSALHTVSEALGYGAGDAESVKNLYRRLYADVPELPPMAVGCSLPNVEQMHPNISDYDVFLKKGGVANA